MGRLVRPQPQREESLAAAGDGDGYLDRVAKYVPSEIVAGYIALNGAATALPVAWRFGMLAGIFVLCLVLTPFYLKKMAKPGDPTQPQTTISTIAH